MFQHISVRKQLKSYYFDHNDNESDRDTTAAFLSRSKRAHLVNTVTEFR